MKRTHWIVSSLFGIVVVVFVLVSGVVNRFWPQPGLAQSSLDVALTTMLTSHTRWQSVDGAAEFLWYGSDGKMQSYTNKFAIALPDKVYVDVIDNTGLGVSGMWISDGQAIYNVDKKRKTYAQSAFSKERIDTSNLPTRLSQLHPDGIITHPLVRLIAAPVAEYLFPIWFPQGHPGDMYALQKEDNFLGRKVWVVTCDTIYHDNLTAWVDQETGIILKYNQMRDGKKFLEMTFTAFHVNEKILPDVFGPPPGYALSSPQIPVREISTRSAPAALVAQPSSAQQKKEILLLHNIDQRRYYLSDFSGAEITPLELPAEIDTIAMSPDGRSVAYMPVNYGEDRAAIYLLDIDDKKNTKLTNEDDITLGIGLLGWSPDSREIAFGCWVRGTQGVSLCSVDVTGTIKVLVKSEVLDVTDMPDGAIAPSWSADGSKIAFQSSRSPSALAEGVKTRVPVDLWLFDVASRQAKRIFVSDAAGISMIMQPVFLTDENAVLFSGRKDTYNTIFKYNLDTQEIQDITVSGKRYDMGNIVLSPDGKTFLAYIPLSDDGSQYAPVLYSVDGALIKQLDALKNLQVVSWGE